MICNICHPRLARRPNEIGLWTGMQRAGLLQLNFRCAGGGTTGLRISIYARAEGTGSSYNTENE